MTHALPSIATPEVTKFDVAACDDLATPQRFNLDAAPGAHLEPKHLLIKTRQT